MVIRAVFEGGVWLACRAMSSLSLTSGDSGRVRRCRGLAAVSWSHHLALQVVMRSVLLALILEIHHLALQVVIRSVLGAKGNLMPGDYGHSSPGCGKVWRRRVAAAGRGTWSVPHCPA